MAKHGHNAKAIAHAKYSVWVKKWNWLTHARNVSTNILKSCSAKNGSKKQLLFEKWEHFENGQTWPQCKGYSPCKILNLGQKIKLPKTCKNDSINTLELFYAKNGSKKQVIFEKWEHFKNSQKWPQCKGYSPCKILSLGQKMKLPKTCEKRFYKQIGVFLRKKNSSKKQVIFEKWEDFENGQKWPQCKSYSPIKILSLGQKIKLPRTCEKRFYKHIGVVLCKKTAPKNS